MICHSGQSIGHSSVSPVGQSSWFSRLLDYLGWSVVPFTLHQYDQSVSPVFTVQSVSPVGAASDQPEHSEARSRSCHPGWLISLVGQSG